MSKAAYAAAVVALVLGWTLLVGSLILFATLGICPEFTAEAQMAATEAGLNPISPPWDVGDGIAIGLIVASICGSTAVLGSFPLLPFRRIFASTLGLLLALIVVTALVFGISFLTFELMVTTNPNRSHEWIALEIAREWATVAALVLGVVEGLWILGTRRKLDPTLPA